MAENTGVSWAHHTFNICWGCAKVSPACTNCYAEAFAKRTGHDVWGEGGQRRVFGDKHWAEPLKWHRRAARNGVRERVFCSSMCDLFEDHPVVIQELAKLWPLIDATPALDWMLLTKRYDRMGEYFRYPPRHNVWLGVTVESPDYLMRLQALAKVPVVVRFVSYEPALEAIDWEKALKPVDCPDCEGWAENRFGNPCETCERTGETVPIDWLIAGAESGGKRRHYEKVWAAGAQKVCEDLGVHFFYKQSAGFRPGTDPYLNGRRYEEIPVPRDVRAIV